MHYFAELLAEVLEIKEGRAFVLDRLCTPELLGPPLVEPLRRLFEDFDGKTLATYLVGGVLKGRPAPDGRQAQPQVGDASRRRLPPRPSAEPPLPKGQFLLDLRRSLHRPNGQARPPT